MHSPTIWKHGSIQFYYMHLHCVSPMAQQNTTHTQIRWVRTISRLQSACFAPRLSVEYQHQQDPSPKNALHLLKCFCKLLLVVTPWMQGLAAQIFYTDALQSSMAEHSMVLCIPRYAIQLADSIFNLQTPLFQTASPSVLSLFKYETRFYTVHKAVICIQNPRWKLPTIPVPHEFKIFSNKFKVSKMLSLISKGNTWWGTLPVVDTLKAS